MRVFGRDATHLDELLTAITEYGVVAVRPQDAVLEAAAMDGVFPERLLLDHQPRDLSCA